MSTEAVNILQRKSAIPVEPRRLCIEYRLGGLSSVKTLCVREVGAVAREREVSSQWRKVFSPTLPTQLVLTKKCA